MGKMVNGHNGIPECCILDRFVSNYI